MAETGKYFYFMIILETHIFTLLEYFRMCGTYCVCYFHLDINKVRLMPMFIPQIKQSMRVCLDCFKNETAENYFKVRCVEINNRISAEDLKKEIKTCEKCQTSLFKIEKDV